MGSFTFALGPFCPSVISNGNIVFRIGWRTNVDIGTVFGLVETLIGEGDETG